MILNRRESSVTHRMRIFNLYISTYVHTFSCVPYDLHTEIENTYRNSIKDKTGYLNFFRF